jgi:hypothetical protein
VDANLSEFRTIDLSGDAATSSTGVINLNGITSAITGTTLKGVVSGNNTITGGAGVDSITGGSVSDTISGGAGGDVLTGAGGVDTFVFASTAALNGADTIKDFGVGADGDKLNFEAFLSTSSTEVDRNSGLSPAITEYTAASVGALDVSNKIVLFADPTPVTATSLLAEFAIGAAFSPDTTKAVVLSGTAGSGNVLVWYVDESLGTLADTIDAGDIVLVGTLESVDIANLTVDNFVIA